MVLAEHMKENTVIMVTCPLLPYYCGFLGFARFLSLTKGYTIILQRFTYLWYNIILWQYKIS